MGKMKFPGFGLNKWKNRLGGRLRTLTQAGLRQIFEKIDQLGIKKGVDELGLDGFINQCALLAAGSGVITGIGGSATVILGIPFDTVNLISQQFRVSLAVTYARTGMYQVRFEDFVKLANTSLKEEAGVAATKVAMEEFTKKIMIGLGARTTKRVIPVVGALIGGSTNYFFIKQVAKSLKQGN